MTTPEQQRLETLLSSEMANKLHKDGTFHITPELMQIFAEQVVALAKLTAERDAMLREHAKMRDNLVSTVSEHCTCEWGNCSHDRADGLIGLIPDRSHD